MSQELLGPETALVVVDVQNCFTPGGSLAVPSGDRVVQPLNAYIEAVALAGGTVAASLDWHPEDHISFAARGGPWPPHCVKGTEGAQFHPDLRLPSSALIVRKGMNPDAEAYSAFDDTSLAKTLKDRGLKRLLVGGLATDYCVRQTVLDALSEGFEVLLLVDAVAPVEVKPGDGQRAIDEMTAAGAQTMTLADLMVSGHAG